MALAIFTHGYQPTLGDTVVELGACRGEETLELSDLVGDDGLVLAVEPDPDSYEQLLDALDDRPNVQPIQAAVLAKGGLTYLSDDEDPMFRRVVTASPTIVKAVTLDALTRGLDVVDLLKVNIEGSEVEALEGGTATVARTRHAVVACHDFRGLPTKAAVRHMLERHGFTVTCSHKPASPWEADYLYAEHMKWAGTEIDARPRPDTGELTSRARTE